MASKQIARVPKIRFVRQGEPLRNGERELTEKESLSELKQQMERSIGDRSARTPITEAIHLVSFTIPKAFADPKEPKFREVVEHIVNDYYGPMLADKSFTETALDEFIGDAFDKRYHIDLVEKVAAYCAFAVRAFWENNERLAWTYIEDAQYWAGVIMVSKRRSAGPGPATLLANMKAAKLKKEYVAIEKYWLTNIDRKLSAQKAADEILLADITTFSHKKIAEIVSALRRGETFR